MTEPEQKTEATVGIVETVVHETLGKVGDAIAEKTRKAPDVILIVVGLIGLIGLLGWAVWITVSNTQLASQKHNAEVVLLLKEQIAQSGMFNQQIISQMQAVNILTATVPDDHRRTEAKLDAMVLEFIKDREERRDLLKQQIEASRMATEAQRLFAEAISQNTAAIAELAKNGESPK